MKINEFSKVKIAIDRIESPYRNIEEQHHEKMHRLAVLIPCEECGYINCDMG